MMNVIIKPFFLAITIKMIAATCVIAQNNRPVMSYENPDGGEISNVNLSTGELGIQIPITTLSSHGVTMPLFLTYNYNGYKIDNTASWVGSGWSISGIGSISRNLNSFPDDEAILIPNLNHLPHEGGYLRHGRSVENSQWNSDDLPHIAAGRIDMVPDIFNYNGVSGNGSFILQKEQESLNSTFATTVPFNTNDISIFWEYPTTQPLSARIGSFRVSDEFGNATLYGEQEFSAIVPGQSPCYPSDLSEQYGAGPGYNGSYVSNWLATEVHNCKGELAYSLSYSDESVITNRIQNDYRSIKDVVTTCIDNYEYGKKYIERIDYEYGYVVFERGPFEELLNGGIYRRDLDQHYPLSWIKIYSHESQDPILKVRFFYEYLECSYDELVNPLLLAGVKIENDGGEIILDQRFSYYDSPESEYVPDEMRKAKDFWGYFNGALSNTNGLPKVIHDETVAEGPVFDEGNDLEPSLEHVQMGALKEVKNYATGGSNEFVYELNSFSAIGNYESLGDEYLTGVRNGPGIRIKEILSHDGVGGIIRKAYNYAKFSDPLKSSGILTTPILFHRYWKRPNIGDPKVFEVFSNNLVSSNFSGESPITYTNVSEYTCDSSSDPCTSANGKTMYWFTYSPNVGEVDQPIISFYSPHWRRGLPSRKAILNSSGDTLSVNINRYSFIDFGPDIQLSKRSSIHELVWDDDNNWPTVIEDSYTIFNVWKSEKVFLESTTERIFNINEQEHYDETVTYFYSNPNSTIPSREERTLADGSKLVTKRKFFSDYDPVTLTTTQTETSCILAWHMATSSGDKYPDLPVEIAVFKENNGDELLLRSSINIYKNYIPENQPKFAYSMSTDLSSPLPNYSMSETVLAVISGTPQMKLEFDESIFKSIGKRIVEYDNSNQPIEFEKFIFGQEIQPTPVTSDVQILEFNSVLKDPSNNRINARIDQGRIATSRYTSFESDYSGGWMLSNDDLEFNIVEASEEDYAVTGKNYYDLGTVSENDGDFNSGVDTNTLPQGSYVLSFWKKGFVVPYLSQGGTVIRQSQLNQGDWTYIEFEISWNSDDNYVTISGDGFIDEIRLHEIDAQISTFGYNLDGTLMYRTNGGAEIISFEYDNEGRLEWKLNRKKKVLEYNQYSLKDFNDQTSFNKNIRLTPLTHNLSKEDIIAGNYDENEVIKVATYTDGLGRFRQRLTFDVHGVGNTSDKVEFALYDEFGRELKKYLPYYANLNGDESYRPNAVAEQLAYYQNLDDPQERTDSPWVETIVEASPLQRVIEQGGIGDDLQPGMGHSTTLDYGWNEATDEIYHWQYVENGGAKKAVLVNTELMWPAGTLRKVTTTDPDGKVTKVFTDMRGREVARCLLAKTHLVSGKHETGTIGHTGVGSQATLVSYTVYDDFDRPRFEISPFAMEEVSDQLTPGLDFELNSANRTNLFKNRIVYYEYDEKGRLSYRSLPIDKEVNYVFDVYDRVIMSQDSEQSLDDKWSFIKYDSRGRTVMTGEIESTLDRGAHQAAADLVSQPYEVRTSSSGPSGFNYTNDAYPSITANDVYAAYFFDNYNFTRNSSSDFVPFGDITTCTEITRGLATGSRVRVFEGDGTSSQTLLTVVYYDDDAQIIQTYSDNHKGGFDRVDNYINDYGQIDQSIQHHKYEHTSDTHTFKTRYVYFPESRKVQNTYCQLDDDPEVMVSNRYYDEKGQLKDLKYHRKFANYLQRIDYRYNAQGRLTHINNTALIDDGEFNHDDDDIFGQELTYFTPSPEYNDPGSVQYGDPLAEYNFVPQYGGNISSMMWNAKTPEQDGTTLSRYAYVYRYDDLGQLTEARFAADDPSMPGEFTERLGEFDEMVNYDLGGNILKINRNHSYYGAPVGLPIVDELTYKYTDGYKLESVSDNAVGGFQPAFKHFVNGVNQTVEYTYDEGNRLIEDRNKKVRFAYNDIGLPMKVEHMASDYYVRYTYDAAGNKLQKYQYLPPCPPGVLCSNEDPYDMDYIGNFVYEKGELKMVYHPEGVIRPTPSQASNETEYVYDYFVKDYLGNVRAVITEEDAEIVDKFLATMEDVHAGIEEANFDNINETREDLPTGYPIDASVPFNQRIAELSAANGTEIGPSLVLPVRKGEKVSLSTRYFYEEDAPGTTYDNVGFFVDEILIALASSGVNVLHLTESQLLNIAAGDPAMAQSITSLLNSNFDNSDIYKPHAYLVWMLYDNQMKLIPQGSGAQKVVNPNELETLIESNITATADGYMHVYVSNGSEAKVNFDNFLVQHQKGKVRQINDYYPYGLSISGLHGDHDDYLDKYTGKELQTGEFDPSLSSGLEMFDFGSRFYDPQLGRWFAPDPAEQFMNPYLGIGNNPVRYVDPNGEEIVTAAIIIGAAIGAYIGGSAANGMEYNPTKWEWDSGDTWGGIGIGAVIGGLGGWGYAIAAPAVAGTGFFSSFGASGTAVAYSLVGGAAMGAAGYGAGLAGGVLHSNGNWEYANETGKVGFRLGAAIGSVLGGAHGISKGAKYNAPELEAPEIAWNSDLSSSRSHKSLNNIHQGDLTEINPNDLRRIYGKAYNEFVAMNNDNLLGYSVNSGLNYPEWLYESGVDLYPDPMYLPLAPSLEGTFARVHAVVFTSSPTMPVPAYGITTIGGELQIPDKYPFFSYSNHFHYFDSAIHFRIKIQWIIPNTTF